MSYFGFVGKVRKGGKVRGRGKEEEIDEKRQGRARGERYKVREVSEREDREV